jgi:hypothetical protein
MVLASCTAEKKSDGEEQNTPMMPAKPQIWISEHPLDFAATG